MIVSVEVVNPHSPSPGASLRPVCSLGAREVSWKKQLRPPARHVSPSNQPRHRRSNVGTRPAAAGLRRGSREICGLHGARG
ncbi:hypothetical protein NDU88_010732 [Pleurodeles waltl]|uniref:Uncharacterized protein n=1 Tax=Pleurodeles waltl TaxID=8319 RepID=A0AAV7S281_PLEWA|nr:hypothetical protein NDU88_010732 [Pleurodeles waltl]